VPSSRMPKGFENGHQGLNFLDRDKGYYYYKYGLYSAGHAYLNLAKSDTEEQMIQQRDRSDTLIIGDSGGFQIATGVLKIDWTTFKTPAGDKMREDILRWLEHTADWSMTLDVPAFAAEGNLSAKTGLKKFEDTLDVSLYNLDYFVKNRKPGATKFLNVLSGSTLENGITWYDAVKQYSDPKWMVENGFGEDRTLEGWAFAGVNRTSMEAALTQILLLRQDNLLKDKDWIHFLGIGRLDWGCYLTSIMRQLNKHDNPRLKISYDAASPFVATAYGLAYNYNYFDSKRLTYSMGKAIDEKYFKGSQLAMPFQSPIMDRLKVGDVCVLGDTDPNKNGKIGRTSWDTYTYLLYMMHNTYNHIQATQEINRLADIEHLRKNVSYKDWTKTKKSETICFSDFVPNKILFFESFVKDLLDPANTDPFGMIDHYRPFLETLDIGKISNHSYKGLFDFTEQLPDEDKLADINDEKLVKLESEFK